MKLRINKLALFTFCLAVAFSSCNDEKASKDVEVIERQSSLEAVATDLFEQIKVIPLEITDLALVTNITHLEVWDDKIFVFQTKTMALGNILCFSKSGKFLYKIDHIGQGPEEYTSLYEFFIDKKLNHTIIHSDNNRFIHWDMQGKFLYKIDATDIYSPSQFLYLNDSTYLAVNNGSFPPENIGLLYLDAKTMNIRYQSNSINETYFDDNKICMYNDRFLYLTFSDSIYDISDTTNVYAKYFFYHSDSHHEWKKQKSKKEPYYKGVNIYDKESVNQMNQRAEAEHESFLRGEYILIIGMSENGKYLAFNCMAGNRDDYVLFYDKENKKVYDTKNIDFDGFQLAECSVFGADGSFYCVLPTEITDEDKAKIKNSSAFSETDKKILLEHKFDDNPVILVLK